MTILEYQGSYFKPFLISTCLKLLKYNRWISDRRNVFYETIKSDQV